MIFSVADDLLPRKAGIRHTSTPLWSTAPQRRQASNAEPLRIVHVVSSLAVGGMERFVLRLASEQKKAGQHVTVVALHGGPLLTDAMDGGLDVTVVSGGRLRRFLASVRAIATATPDVIHAHNPTCLHYAVGGKLASRARLIMTDHAQGHGLIRMPGRFERRCVDAVVAVSRHTAAHPISPDLSVKTDVIHNGVQPTSLNRETGARRRPRSLQDRFVGVMPASLKPVKGHRVLLESVDILKRADVPITMLLAGEGPELGELRERAHALGLTDDDVQFLGFRSDVTELLAFADFMVLPSLSEGLPLSILEAMIIGTPVIATRVGGIPEVITDRVTGLLVPPGDPVQLADTIRVLYLDPKSRKQLGLNGQGVACSAFSFDRMREQYERLYLRLANRR